MVTRLAAKDGEQSGLLIAAQTPVAVDDADGFAPVGVFAGGTFRTREGDTVHVHPAGRGELVEVKSRRGAIRIGSSCITCLVHQDDEPVLWTPPHGNLVQTPDVRSLLDGPDNDEAFTGFLAGMMMAGGKLPQTHSMPSIVTMDVQARRTFNLVLRGLERYADCLAPSGKPFHVFTDRVVDQVCVRSRRIDIALNDLVQHPQIFASPFRLWSARQQKAFVAGVLAAARPTVSGQGIEIRTVSSATFSQMVDILRLFAGLTCQVQRKTEGTGAHYRSGWNSLVMAPEDLDRAAAFGLVYEVSAGGYVPSDRLPPLTLGKISKVTPVPLAEVVRLTSPNPSACVHAEGFVLRLGDMRLADVPIPYTTAA